ncbi:MAG: methyltransferase domain-containing protein [Steroidobacteraceae bacterium]
MIADSSGAPDHPWWCPQCCAAPLDPSASPWRCVSCGMQFPQVDGIPWLFAEPAQRLADWRQRFALLAREYQAQRDALRIAASSAASATTRHRLEQHAAALASHLSALDTLLAPLGQGESLPRRETLLALRTQVPLAQDLTSYYVNLHRDWVWGDAENNAAHAICDELLRQSPPQSLLVAGSGGGRLAFDLHASLQPHLTLALDLNPLLQIVAARVSRGETLRLWEFPLAPRTAADQAIERALRAPAAARPGLRFVLGDALRTPLRSGAFDAVLTPWFIDIVPQPFAEVAARINRLLPAGGQWVNFGSVAFAQADPARCHSKEEVLEIVAASGFELLEQRDDELPYMRSPASRHARLERTLAFRAVKRSQAVDPGPAWSLPEWLADASQPVPKLPHFETQGLVKRIYAFVMALIDGRRSSRDIAAYLVEQKLMDPSDAEAAVRGFLTQLYEESRRRTRF